MLGVVGLVIGGIWVAASTINGNQRVNQTVGGILTMVSNVQKTYQGVFPTTELPVEDPDNVTVVGEIALGNNTVPGFNYNRAAGTIDDPWGHPFDSRAGYGLELNTIYLSLNWPIAIWMGLSPSACIRVASRVSAAAGPSGDLVGVVFTNNSATPVTTFPFIPTTAQCSCGSATCEVGFGFKGP